MNQYEVAFAERVEVDPEKFQGGVTTQLEREVSQCLLDQISRSNRLPSEIGTGITAGQRKGYRLIQCAIYRLVYAVDEVNRRITIHQIR